MTDLTVTLDLRDKPVLVVGGGPRSAARAAELLEAGAVITVAATALCEDLQDRYAEGALAWVTAATPELVAASWWVSTVGADPAQAALVERWAGEARVWCEGPQARPYAGADLDSAVTEASVSLRDLREHRSSGKVVLVGGGPGADDLLTVRARRELARADVVVTDRLAPIGVLTQLGSAAEVIDVGKTPYHHPVPQHEINAILVERAQRGQYVVRLKGGDPFLLGRGGEEWLACRAAGVEVEVVPGVTSAIAAPAAAGVPVTHRGIASGVLTISGHDEVSPDLLAQWPHTIVVLMGMGRLPELTAGLIRAGKDPATPVAVVHRAWTDRQRQVSGTLATIAGQVAAAGIGNPAAIVIGEVVTVLEPGDGHQP